MDKKAIADMDFATEMLEEAIDYNIENGVEADDDLIGLERDLRAAMQAGRAEDASALAREVRRYLIANGYADDDELAMEV